MIKRLKPGGLLLVATVLPFCGMVHEGKVGRINHKRAPLEPFPLHPAAVCGANPSFAQGAAAFLATARANRKELEMLAWTRLPYLSSGDQKKTHYSINSALFVLRYGEEVKAAATDGATGAAGADAAHAHATPSRNTITPGQ